MHKLLALSTSSNVHEAASAAAAAQALIARHQLEDLLAADVDADDPSDPITDGREAPLEVATRPRRFRAVLASGVAELNGGVAWSLDVDDAVALCFCGRASDRQIVAALFGWLAVRIEWLSATAAGSRSRSRSWHEAFRVGAAETIVARLAEGGGPAGDDVERAALVQVEPRRAARAAAVDRFVQANLRFGTGKGFSVDARGFEHGRVAGRSLPLPPKKG